MDPPIILIHIPKNVQQKTANMSDMSQELERELEKAAEECSWHRQAMSRCGQHGQRQGGMMRVVFRKGVCRKNRPGKPTVCELEAMAQSK